MSSSVTVDARRRYRCIVAICRPVPFALSCGSLGCRMLIWNTEFMRYAYPAIFSEEQDGVTVTFPDVPEAITWGATRPEARERAADALISALSTYVEENRPNPKPSPARGRDVVSVTALEATKLALHDAMLAAWPVQPRAGWSARAGRKGGPSPARSAAAQCHRCCRSRAPLPRQARGSHRAGCRLRSRLDHGRIPNRYYDAVRGPLPRRASWPRSRSRVVPSSLAARWRSTLRPCAAA